MDPVVAARWLWQNLSYLPVLQRKIAGVNRQRVLICFVAGIDLLMGA